MSGMSIWEILLLGVGLSMDAFAVSICLVLIGIGLKILLEGLGLFG